MIGYRHVALVGLGLIASSLSHAIRRSGAPVRITGHSRSAATRDEARRLGLGGGREDLAEAVEGADLVILCVPIGAMAAVADEIAPRLAPGATLSDVGSVKRAVIEAVAPRLAPGTLFVPAHPLAGTEHSGPGAGFAQLFDNRWCLLTPLPDSPPAAVEKLAAFWRALGARVDTMDPDHHDLVLAVTSHVPHLIAYTMVGVHAVDPRAERPPEAGERLDRRRVAAGQGGQQAPAVVKELGEPGARPGVHGAGQRMRRNEGDPLGDVRRHRLDHRPLDRADVA